MNTMKEIKLALICALTLISQTIHAAGPEIAVFAWLDTGQNEVIDNVGTNVFFPTRVGTSHRGHFMVTNAGNDTLGKR